MAIRLSALRADRRFTPQKHDFTSFGTHFCENRSMPQGLERPEGFGKLIKWNLLIRPQSRDLPAFIIVSVWLWIVVWGMCRRKPSWPTLWHCPSSILQELRTARDIEACISLAVSKGCVDISCVTLNFWFVKASFKWDRGLIDTNVSMLLGLQLSDTCVSVYLRWWLHEDGFMKRTDWPLGRYCRVLEIARLWHCRL
jgi:hypothetical protein